ncbi:MAG: hypothetical protein IJW67_10730, partial [Blautia sp.]|nr:hypothetical protein [Blautia sp.]
MKLGCGLFGLGFALDMDFWGTMKKLASAGFTAVEPLLAFADDPALSPESPIPGFMKSILWNESKLREYLPKLKELGLSVSSMHVGFLFGMTIEEGCRQMIELAENTGIKHYMTSLEFDSEEKVNHAIALMNESVQLLKGTD